MTIKKKDLSKLIIEHLGLRDYRYEPSDGLLFDKREGGNRVELAFAYNKFDGYQFSGMIARKSIDSIESMLKRYYKKYSIDKMNWTIYQSSSKIPENDELQWLDVVSEETLLKLLPYFKHWVYEELLPEMDKYNTVEDVYNRTMELPENKRQRFVCQPFPARFLIMKGILRTEDFESYSKFIQETLDKFPEYRKQIDYLYMDELIDELRSIQ